MKSFALCLSLLTWLSACASDRGGQVRLGYGPASRIARNSGIPGRNIPGQCLPFAQALHARLEAAGIPSRIIEYSYDGPGFTPPENPPSSHAVVAYEDGGRTYIIDNQSWAPTWVRDGTPAKMAQLFSGINVAVRGARIMPDMDELQSPGDLLGHNPSSRNMMLLSSSR